MRVFHTMVFDENIEGAGTASPLYSDPTHNPMLGLVEKLSIFALTDTVTGTGTLVAQIEESADQVHWVNKGTTAEVSGTLSTTAVTPLVGRDAGTVPSSGFLRLRVTLSNSSQKAHVRIWVTGRGEQTMQ